MEDSRREIKLLTGLRAVAAFWVLSFHLAQDVRAAVPPVAVWLEPVMANGFLGVGGGRSVAAAKAALFALR